MTTHTAYGAILLILATVFPAVSGAAMQLGMDAAAVEQELGTPQGRLARGGREAWTYPQGTLEIEKGRLVWISPDFGRAKSGRHADQPRAPKVLVIANGGQVVDLPALLVPGGITVVDFYADWCPPCRVISPQLEALSARDPQVFLRKIDIVNWESPVTAQFKLSSIPSIRVFNSAGKAVGSPTHRIDEVRRNLEAARP